MNPSIGKVHHSGQLEASGRLRGARGGPAGRRGERNQGGDGSGDRVPVDRRLQVRLKKVSDYLLVFGVRLTSMVV